MKAKSKAKSYLMQLRSSAQRIKTRMKILEEMYEMLGGLKSPTLDVNKVQTSMSGDRLADEIVKYEKQRDDLQREIGYYLSKKQKILRQIEEMPDTRYSEILTYKYIEGKRMEEIATLMNYEYYYACRLHGRALRSFEKLYLEKETAQQKTN